MPVYMKIDGVDGESQNPEFPGAIDVFVAANGVEREASSGSGGGTRANLTDISIAKPAEKSSPKLFLACCSGTQFKNVEIEFTDLSEGGEVVYMKYRLERCVITSWSTSGDGGAVPTETLTLNFTKIEYSYMAKDGSVDTSTWDTRTNTGG